MGKRLIDMTEDELDAAIEDAEREMDYRRQGELRHALVEKILTEGRAPGREPRTLAGELEGQMSLAEVEPTFELAQVRATKGQGRLF